MSLQSTDQIADLITRIRNAIMVGKNEILVPTSKLKVGVVEVLKKNGYVAEYEVIEGTPRGVLKVTINEPGTIAKINEISKVSKPGRRVYSAAEGLPVVKSGRGMVIVSTSKGLMTGREAKKNRLGGEILVKVWQLLNSFPEEKSLAEKASKKIELEVNSNSIFVVIYLISLKLNSKLLVSKSQICLRLVKISGGEDAADGESAI